MLSLISWLLGTQLEIYDLLWISSIEIVTKIVLKPLDKHGMPRDELLQNPIKASEIRFEVQYF